MLRCKEVTRKIASDELAEARWSQRIAFRFHLLMCRHCRRYAAQLLAIGTAARNLWGQEPEDPDTLERLKRKVLGPSPGGPQD
ncbi:anti-sigma factor [Acidobacteria bacterium AH-259-O06]|nr:anti-sigma factor [Acidobacteria bacterium AH-259-O06]